MEKNIADMTAQELFDHIEAKKKQFNTEQKHLKALLRCKDGGAALLEKKPK